MRNFGLAFLFTMLASATSQAQSLRGHSDDIMVLIDVETSIVAGWLPEEVSLIDESESTHPVFISFGRQENARALRYTEVIVKVPQVRFNQAQPDSIFNYYKVLYMDNHQAVWWGIVLYDSPKKFSPIFNDDRTIIAYTDEPTDQRSPIFEAIVEPGSQDSIDIDHPNVVEFEDYMSYPGITLRNGSYKCWSSTRSSVEMIPLKVKVTLFPGFAEGIEEPISQTFDGIDSERFGAHMQKSDWNFFRTSCE